MKLLTISLAILLLLPSAALAASNEEAEQELFDASLTPTALYPDDLSSDLSDADVTVSFPSALDYQVRWDRVNNDDPDINDGYIVLQRKSVKKLKKEIRSIRKQGNKPKKTKIGKVRGYKACGHVCGFLWIQGGRGYTVFGMYYEDKLAKLDRDQRQLIKGLAAVEDQQLDPVDEDTPVDEDPSNEEDL